jgi:maltooligosyltrehalose trehalohydrolase
LSPYVPLLFMGEEWGEVAPFPYFVSHTDPDLVESVRRGRREEFAAFGWSGEAPDPQSEAVFESARLNRALLGEGRHRLLRDTYRELIELRRSHPVLQSLDKDRLEAGADEASGLVTLRRWNDDRELLALFHFRRVEPFTVRPGSSDWRLVLHSGDERLGGPGGDLWDGERLTLQPCSFAVLDRAIGDEDEDDDL